MRREFPIEITSIQNIPLLIQDRNCLVSCKVKLTRHYRNIIVGDGPLIVVFALIEIDKVPRHPEVTSSIGVETLIKIFYPLGIGLPADANAFDWLSLLFRKIYI